MVDSVEHLDLIERSVGQGRSPVRVCMDVDAGWWLAGGKVRIGTKRSPVHSTDDAVLLARSIVGRKGFQLVGIMAYEGQIAGVGDAPPRRPLRGLAIRAMQKRSAAELAERRAQVVEAVSAIAALEFVNGGGTGSLEVTSAEVPVTEIAAGSGLYGPALFDAYRRFSPRPAAFFCLPVVRKPSPAVATVLGGGYLASGPGDKTRLPVPYLPSGLRFDSQEGAGEVQTPLPGPGAAELQIGDRVYFRHAKAGEMCERFERLYLVAGDEIVEVVPTYRGEGRCFL
jgi:D-serine deaminase-like pyridoxal phosphate-dependent protein